MKRLNYMLIISALFLTGTTLPSCDNFLDVPPQGLITEEEIQADPAAALELVNGVYNSLWSGNMHGFVWVGATNIASDDADKGSTPADAAATFGAVDNLEHDPSNFIFNNLWTSHYAAIARANQALARIPLSPADEATRNRYLAEVRFLRGYFYFNLVRLFGGVPLVDRVPTPEEATADEFQTRASKEAVYQFIQNDLQFAANNLPVRGETQTGRATKAAAQAFLAKVHLYQGNWQRVYNLTDSIITGQSGTYALLQDYETIWREAGENSAESIFEVQTGVNASCNAAIPLYSVSQGPRAGGRGGWQDRGWGFGTPSQSLVNAYEPGDLRREATIMFINPAPQGTLLWDGFRVPSRDSVQNDRYNYKAYHSRTAESFCGSPDNLPKNLRLMRLGEVILMRAEAAFMINNPEVAREDINLLRDRAGLDDLQTINLEAIWRERRIELALEHDRFFDLVRQGRAQQVFAAQGKTFVPGQHEVFPIPQQQIQLSGDRLTQNPGY